MKRILHVICLRAPWPDDTGGAREMLDRLKALKEQGISIRLHFFTDQPIEPVIEQLSPFCDQLYAYPKKLSWRNLLHGQPYIVACRSNEELNNRLSNDEFPILFEGIHTTAAIQSFAKKGRKLVIRMHNDEASYYRELARSTKNLFKRLYFYWESGRIHRWMKKLPAQQPLACIQEQERTVLKSKYPQVSAFFLPPVIPQTIFTQPGVGSYCLYHGDLSVEANERAVIWLLKRVFAKCRLPLVIAGKSPSARLEKLVHFYQHACLIANPSRAELVDLIRKAQINVLPSKTRSGIKLKVFDALQYGRHCVIDRAISVSAPWTDSCVIISSAEQMTDQIQKLFPVPFTEAMIEARRLKLSVWREQLDPVEPLIKRLW